MKTILISTLFLFSITAIGQNFFQAGPDTLLNEGEVSQVKLKSYIYLGNSTNKNAIKNEIYTFFDSQINQNPEDYNPTVDVTTSYSFYIYKKTDVLNENFVFVNNINLEDNPLINGHNNDIIAIVDYSISSNGTKSIYFYENRNLVKRFLKNREITLTSSMIQNLYLDDNI